MPRQKLTRKPPTRRGKLGQTQKPGAHDPVHQHGEGREKPTTEFRKSREPDNDIESERPRTSRKESPL
jgi:hypothetical protein